MFRKRGRSSCWLVDRLKKRVREESNYTKTRERERVGMGTRGKEKRTAIGIYIRFTKNESVHFLFSLFQFLEGIHRYCILAKVE